MADLNYDSLQLSESSQKKRKQDELLENQTEEVSDEDFLCPICLQLLIEPVVMPCSHELCKVCFTQNVQEANLQCPICRLRISSWARKQARNGTLICQERWDLIQKLFPKKCERRMAGEDDENELDFYSRRPLKRVLSQNGAIRSEYEEEMKKIRKAREEEIKASEEFIRRLMEEEKIVDSQMQQMVENDEELAKKLQQQIQTPVQASIKPCSSKTAVNKGKGKTKGSNNSQTLDKWFSPTSKLHLSAALKNSQCELSPASSNIRTNILHLQSCNLKQKQEQDDLALALKLQEEFDRERTVDKDVNRRKGTVDEYLLRQRSSSESTS